MLTFKRYYRETKVSLHKVSSRVGSLNFLELNNVIELGDALKDQPAIVEYVLK